MVFTGTFSASQASVPTGNVLLSYMNISKHRERIEKVFTVDNALKYVEFAIKAATNSLQFEEIQNFADAMMLQRYTAVFGHLAYSLGEYQTAMLDFAEK